jgi:hypothetical protein
VQEGYDSDDEYGDGGSAHTKYSLTRAPLSAAPSDCHTVSHTNHSASCRYEQKKSKSAAKNYERERAQTIRDTKKNTGNTNVLECVICLYQYCGLSTGPWCASTNALIWVRCGAVWCGYWARQVGDHSQAPDHVFGGEGIPGATEARAAVRAAHTALNPALNDHTCTSH